ncbi:MAG: diadenylate cyclase CdaA [Caldicoprobacterales bacterium]|jgi:diadenylate cyclase|nr:diadenylate cyclase CdaA [Clostridia bacterium]MDI9512464.1 diadenylate cyclase CdaA [Bacillota bacterium]NLH58144.1 TIGR00159 family protein [Clostridiales bacterium]HCW03165.1 TIGR00159 family protein [Clostridium sp.]
MWDWISRLFSYIEPYIQFPWVIRHIIDIAIVSFVLYRLLLLIKETRAEQVLKGLAILLFATKLSEILQLYTIFWILKNTVTVGVIAILIVFQPELRRALEHIGRGKFFDRSIFIRDDKEPSLVIDEIVKAAQNMAEKKIGALIVVERNTGINDVIETGVSIDAELTGALLENIFMPNAPLHDGAVIVRKDRIAAAGCFLPLTENPNISKQLGTRHRAALGISESSDALAIIVSEENGIISTANNGKLTRYLDGKGLEDMLNKIYVKDKQARSIFPKKWRAKE